MSPFDTGQGTIRPNNVVRRIGFFLWSVLQWARELHLYAIVGGFVFLLDLVTFWLLIQFGHAWYMHAHIISRAVGGSACFFLNRSITFKRTDWGGVGGDLLRFLALYTVSFLVSSVFIFVAIQGVGLTPVPGKVVAECLVFLFNYTAMKYWVVQPKKV